MLLLNISLTLLVVRSTGYKILIYSPQIGHSHVNFFGKIADTLVEAGHDAVLYVPAYYDDVTTTAAKLARVITRPLDFKLPYAVSDILSDTWTGDGSNYLQILKMVIGTAANIKPHCEMQLADKKLIDQLRKEHFDVGITEAFNVCGYAIFHTVGVRTYIGAFATNLIDVISDAFGVSNNPSYVPAAFSQLSDVMSYEERWQNIVTYIATVVMSQLFYRPFLNFEGVAPGFSVDDALASNVFAFVNSEEFLEYPRPITHKIVFVGGIGVEKPQPLTTEYKRIMDNAKGAVVLISFGSVTKSSEMPTSMKDAFVGMFVQLPEVTFIWKYEVDDNIAANITNVIKKKWVPQNDLLAHPKLSAFLTHSGQNSVTESTHAGVPMICVPLFGDQMRNAKIAEKRHVAFIMDKRYITADRLYDAVRTVIYNETYGQSAKRLSQMINKKPISARDRIIRYTEFAAEFGPFHNLDSVGVKLNFIQYHLIDVIVPGLLAFVLVLIASTYAVVRLASLLQRFCVQSKVKHE